MSSLGAHVPGARVLDLFCGSGAYGLEALSRGADEAVFVDSDPDAIAACRANAKSAGVADWTKVRRRDAARYLERDAADDGPFDLVFVDPPYRRGEPDQKLLDGLASAISAHGRVVWEMRKGDASFDPPPGWVVAADRRYGDTRVLMLRRGSEG